MKEYEVIETTADIGIAAPGRDLPEVFARAAAGMVSLMTDPARIEARETVVVTATARDLAGLFAAWLTELLYLFETQDFLAKDFTVTVLQGPPLAPPEADEASGANHSAIHLTAQIRGERIDPARHIITAGIKAVTYHQLELRRVEGLWRARVIFDI